jgi:hypothetical protein
MRGIFADCCARGRLTLDHQATDGPYCTLSLAQMACKLFYIALGFPGEALRACLENCRH